MSSQTIPIKRDFQIQSGFAFQSTCFVDNGVPIARMSNLKDGKLKLGDAKYVSRTWLKTAAAFVLKENDFLIGMSGSLSNYAHVTKEDIPSLLNQRVGRLLQTNEFQDYEYVCYWLKSEPYARYAEVQGEGAAQKNISSAQIGDFQIRYVSLPGQRRIVEILSSIDKTIENTEALIKKYQQIKTGLMHDLFTRGIGADGKLRPPREQAPELYQKTPIGWIPNEWGFGELRSFVQSTQYGISTSLEDNDIGIPVLRMNNILRNRFYVSDLKYSQDPEAYQIKLKRGDILYNRTNSMEHVGKTAIWREELEVCSFASYLVRINVQKSKLDPDFYAHWMSQKSTQNALRRYATPAVQQVNINPTNLQKISIACPIELSEQKLISARIDIMDKKLEAEELVLSKYQSQKLGLMHDLLTGKVDVSIEFTKSSAH